VPGITRIGYCSRSRTSPTPSCARYVPLPQLHEVLDRFLNDDNDMHRLNLTAEEMSRQFSLAEGRARSKARMASHGQDLGSTAAAEHEAAADRQGIDGAGPRVSVRGKVKRKRKVMAAVCCRNAKIRRVYSLFRSLATFDFSDVQPHRDSVSSKSSSSSCSLDDAEVAEVEMLLEAYDMHLEQALSRLQVREGERKAVGACAHAEGSGMSIRSG
jgi:hypothetical protein